LWNSWYNNTTNGETIMIEDSHIENFIEQLTFSFMNEGEQMWFPWEFEPPIEPKPRKRTKLRKKKNKKND